MSILKLFAQPFKALHLPPPKFFSSHTVIITGANTGLGLEAARHIVSLGASKVIVRVRTISKGDTAKLDIETTTGRKGIVEVWPLELESFSSVKSFASSASNLKRLDTAIMNAGLASAQWNLSPEGWERAIQVNVLSRALLSLLLIPILVRTRKTFHDSKPHLVILGSDMHLHTKLPERYAPNILQALNDEGKWKAAHGPVERSSVSKLLDLYITLELARLTPTVKAEPAVIVDVFQPGFCKSELMSREPGAPFLLVVMQAFTARSVVNGSKTLVDAAVQGTDAHGKYLEHQKITEPGPLVTSDEGQLARKRV